VDATVTRLTDAEQTWVDQQLAGAARFVEDYGSMRNTAGLEALDHAWAAWLDRQLVDPEDPNAVINAVGVALGQALVDGLEGFEWVIADDGEGTDLAVFGMPGAGDVLVYPANLVAKRYDARDPMFLQSTHDAIVEKVRQLRARSHND